MNIFRLEISLSTLALLVIFLRSPYICAEDISPVFLPNHVTQTLGEKTVSSILMHERNLWIGTQNGLYIYDGNNLQMPTTESTNIGAFFGSHITSLITSNQGDIWISSINHGVVRYDSDSASFSRPLIIDESILVSSLNIDRRGRLWIGSDKGAFLVDLSQDKARIESSLKNPIVRDASVTGIVEDTHGVVWITSDKGVYVSNNTQQISLKLCKEASDVCNFKRREYTAIHLGSDGKIYVGNADGLLQTIETESRNITLTYDTRIHDTNYITSILEVDETIWIGTDDGLIKYHATSNTGEFLDIENSELANDHITKISKTEHGIWVGTYKGINLVINSSISNYNSKNSGIFNEVLSFAEGESNEFFIGTYQGVYSFDVNKSRHELLPIEGAQTGKGIYRSMSVAYRDSKLYVGTRGSGLRVHQLKNRGERSNEFVLGDTSITKMYVDKFGSLWVGTFSHGLFKFDSVKSGEPEQAPINVLSPDYGPVVSLSSALNNRLLVATETRLVQIDYDEKNRIDIGFSFGDLELRPVILSAKMDSVGAIWIGTLSSGLYKLARNDSVAKRVDFRDDQYRSTQGFSVYEIQIDSLGGVWCTTSNGLHKFGIDTAYIGGLGVNDGLQGKTFNFGASLSDSHGNLYFGGSNGYNKFHPSDIEFLKVIPEMSLTRVSINGKPQKEEFKLNYLEKILLTHKDSNLQIRFHIEDYFLPHETSYIHQLNPLESAPNTTVGHGYATYTNLPPGEYSFHAQGTDSSGNTNTEGIQLKVIVLPAPWRTWWAYTLYALIASGVLWAVWRWYYMYLLKQKAMAYAREMNAEAESAIDELQEQLDVQDALVNTVHRRNIATLEILSSLNQTPEGILKDASAAHSRRSIAALKSLENSLLYQHDHLYADLHRCTDDITTSLLAEGKSNSESISIINDVTNKPVDAEIGALLAIAISELAHNCFVHAFSGRTLGNFIKITLQVTEHPEQNSAHYRLSINDNGVGLPEDFLHAVTEGVRVITLISESLGGELSCPNEAGSEVILTFTKNSFEAA